MRRWIAGGKPLLPCRGESMVLNIPRRAKEHGDGLDAMPAHPDRSATRTGFAAMCLGMFKAILDIQVVATSLPNIQSALHIAPDRMSWIQTVYLIAEVIAIPLTGFLTRVLG